jgi:hypothetical protein
VNVTKTLLPTCRAERSEIGVGAGGRRVIGWPGAAHPANVNTAMKFKETRAGISDAEMFRLGARRSGMRFRDITACSKFV